jgi:hypothetical protein
MSNLIPKTKQLLKIIKKCLPQIRNKHLQKELMFSTLQVIEELKNTKEEKDDGTSKT